MPRFTSTRKTRRRWPKRWQASPERRRTSGTCARRRSRGRANSRGSARRALPERCMTLRDASSEKTRVLFVSPEAPMAGAGGGGLRSASLLEYLREKYSVDVVQFSLRPHSKTAVARGWRNFRRLVRGVPPLFDRYSGYD